MQLTSFHHGLPLMSPLHIIDMIERKIEIKLCGCITPCTSALPFIQSFWHPLRTLLSLLNLYISCKPFDGYIFTASDLCSNITFLSFCLCQTGRVPLRTRLWRCSSESPSALRGESVVYLRQWVWITHAGQLTAPQKSDGNHTTGPNTNKNHGAAFITRTDSKMHHASRCTTWTREAVLYSAAAAEKPEWIPWYRKLLFLWTPASQHTLHSV